MAAFRPRLPGFDVALDYYYDNAGFPPFPSAEEVKTEATVPAPNAAPTTDTHTDTHSSVRDYTHRIRQPNKNPIDGEQFPSAAASMEWLSNTLTLRERAMLKVINVITDRPLWNVKVNREVFVARFKSKTQEMPSKVVPGGYSDAMWEYTVSELRDKAKIFDEYNGVVSLFEAAAIVFKQDVLTTDKELHSALKAAVKKLEDVPEKEKDWRPGSDGKVLDLVHPSLWPLVYGKTRVLRDRTIPLDEALASMGGGEIIPVPELDPRRRDYIGDKTPLFSTKFQWLPAEVTVLGNKAKITSYINNLHPVQHAPMYSIIERLIEKALPLWDAAYDHVMAWKKSCGDGEGFSRILCIDDAVDWDETVDPTAWQPKPREYKYLGPTEFKSGNWFNGKTNLQVIVKFVNIHLTPAKPTYDGGTWHIEGQLNERICATAFFYYDNENVTPSYLTFRTRADSENMNSTFTCGGDSFEEIYGVDTYHSPVMRHGQVLTREGRLVVFPNVYQHHVGSFKLSNRRKAGHRKIVALFLVDPATPVISTANVPPQQQHWYEGDTVSERLPLEIAEMVYAERGCPYGNDEAVRLRAELIEDRKEIDFHVNKAVTGGDWNFFYE